MQVGLLTLDFHLEACRSLKEKRQRIKGLRDRFGRLPQVATCESGAADSLDKSQWSFVCIGLKKSDVARTLANIESHAATELDAVIYRRQIEFL